MSFILFIKLRTYYIIIFLALLLTKKQQQQGWKGIIYLLWSLCWTLVRWKKKKSKRLVSGKMTRCKRLRRNESHEMPYTHIHFEMEMSSNMYNKHNILRCTFRTQAFEVLEYHRTTTLVVIMTYMGDSNIGAKYFLRHFPFIFRFMCTLW